MSIRINSLDKIKRKLGIDSGGPVLPFFTETCYKHMDKYVPRDRNNLRTIVHLSTNSITYMSDYASYQYYGQRKDGTHKVNPENYTTPGTGPYWDKKMISAEMNDVIKEVREYIKTYGGR